MAASRAWAWGWRVAGLLLLATLMPGRVAADPPQTTYLWHLHQPIYWNDQRGYAPDHYETAWDTIQAQGSGRVHPSDLLSGIFGIDDREAAYQYRPKDAIAAMRAYSGNAGAQLNMSGALIENIDSLAGRWGDYSGTWYTSNQTARGWQTAAGKPALDIVNFTYHHSLAPLHTTRTLQMELLLHRRQMELRWGTNPALSRGYFPTEICFSTRLIPILKSVGIEWSIISGNHISRACSDFPLVLGSGGENCEPPNRADVLNPAQTNYYRQTISRGCAPANAAPLAYTPQRAQYVNPWTGASDTLVVVPAAMEFSWVDGYQCFAPSQMDAVKAFNNATRPELLLLAHDGDNAFGGGYSYYMECAPNFARDAAGAGYLPSTVEQYLSQYPVPANAIVHVEDGGWVNADGDFGSPTYINWLYPLLNSAGQPDPVNGWHEKAREYAMFIAAENRVRTAEQASGATINLDRVLNPDASATLVERAWHYYLGALDSGNVYYGTPGDMEVRSTVGINQAVARADQVLGGTSYTDHTDPSVFIPQRWPYNPGAVNFGVSTGYQQKVLGPDFTVWTFAYDVSGLQQVTLRYRVDADGVNAMATTQNETYAGGGEVGAWQSMTMAGRVYPKGNVYNKAELDYYVLPTYISEHYSATISGLTNVLLDYYVEARDTAGNVTRTPIQHVWVGDQSGSVDPGNRVTLTPATPTAGQSALVQYNPTGGPLAGQGSIFLHYGFNNWAEVGSFDAPMTWNATSSRYELTQAISGTATQLDLVFNNGAGTWDNNSGADWHFAVQGGTQPEPPPWTLDGIAESNSLIVAQAAGGLTLWAAHHDGVLYVATNGAANGRDHFIFVTDSLSATRPAPWSKAGTVMACDAYLANEESNNWCGWFDGADAQTIDGSTVRISGGSTGVLEGTIVLSGLWGTVPDQLYIAAVAYGSANGGALVSSVQAPVTLNSDGNLDAGEFFSLGVPVELSTFAAE